MQMPRGRVLSTVSPPMLSSPPSPSSGALSITSMKRVGGMAQNGFVCWRSRRGIGMESQSREVVETWVRQNDQHQQGRAAPTRRIATCAIEGEVERCCRPR
jgi:hypothetical protein